MEEEKEKLQREIDTMNISDDDIIEINAGGKIISALRSTLTHAEDTMLTNMFSGRWEESLKRDRDGRIYLDHDPELIELIVNFLRAKKIEDPSRKKIRPPKISEEKKDEFETLLHYFGLTDFFYPPLIFHSLDINNIGIVQPHGFYVDVTRSENKIQFSYNQDHGGDYFVACKPRLDSSGEGSFWKVTIDVLPTAWLYLGIIGNLDASNDSRNDSTSYGWLGDSSLDARNWSGVTQGVVQPPGYESWITQGECVYFHLKSNKLTMLRVQKNKKCTSTMNVATTDDAYYIHFNIMQSVGTKWTLEPLSEEERARFL